MVAEHADDEPGYAEECQRGEQADRQRQGKLDQADERGEELDQALRIGIALQLTKAAYDADGSKALDAVIDLFSGRDMAEISKAKERQELKEELLETLVDKYEGKVMGVYFTEFVTQ